MQPIHSVWLLPPQKQSQFYSLFLLLKTDTESAFWISVSWISSLVLPFLQKSSATSVIFSAPALLKEKTEIVAEGSFKSWNCKVKSMKCTEQQPWEATLPEEDENGLSVGHPIQQLIVVQEGLDWVNESCVHFIHFIKYKEWPGTDAHIAPNPRLQLVLSATKVKDAERVCVGKTEKNSTFCLWNLVLKELFQWCHFNSSAFLTKT